MEDRIATLVAEKFLPTFLGKMTIEEGLNTNEEFKEGFKEIFPGDQTVSSEALYYCVTGKYV